MESAAFYDVQVVFVLLVREMKYHISEDEWASIVDHVRDFLNQRAKDEAVVMEISDEEPPTAVAPVPPIPRLARRAKLGPSNFQAALLTASSSSCGRGHCYKLSSQADHFMKNTALSESRDS